jgi:hypothetical protein
VVAGVERGWGVKRGKTSSPVDKAEPGRKRKLVNFEVNFWALEHTSQQFYEIAKPQQAKRGFIFLSQRDKHIVIQASHNVSF